MNGLFLATALLAAEPAAARTVLVLAPHPDDEALMSGGVIAAAVARGDAVWVALLTNGGAGCGCGRGLAACCARPLAGCDPGAKSCPALACDGKGFAGCADGDSPLCFRAGREQDSLRGMARLGVPAERVVFLGYPDSGPPRLGREAPLVGPDGLDHTYAFAGEWSWRRTGRHAPLTSESLATDVRTLLEAVKPDEIFTTGPFDYHPDHEQAYLTTRRALEALGWAVPLHLGLVHEVDDGDSERWPRPPRRLNRCTGDGCLVDFDVTAMPTPTAVPAVWMRTPRGLERLRVPPPMAEPTLEHNQKVALLDDYRHQIDIVAPGKTSRCQGATFYASFAKQDEVFLPELAAPLLAEPTATPAGASFSSEGGTWKRDGTAWSQADAAAPSAVLRAQVAIAGEARLRWTLRVDSGEGRVAVQLGAYEVLREPGGVTLRREGRVVARGRPAPALATWELDLSRSGALELRVNGSVWLRFADPARPPIVSGLSVSTRKTAAFLGGLFVGKPAVSLGTLGEAVSRGGRWGTDGRDRAAIARLDASGPAELRIPMSWPPRGRVSLRLVRGEGAAGIALEDGAGARVFLRADGTLRLGAGGVEALSRPVEPGQPLVLDLDYEAEPGGTRVLVSLAGAPLAAATLPVSLARAPGAFVLFTESSTARFGSLRIPGELLVTAASPAGVLAVPQRGRTEYRYALAAPEGRSAELELFRGGGGEAWSGYTVAQEPASLVLRRIVAGAPDNRQCQVGTSCREGSAGCHCPDPADRTVLRSWRTHPARPGERHAYRVVVDPVPGGYTTISVWRDGELAGVHVDNNGPSYQHPDISPIVAGESVRPIASGSGTVEDLSVTRY